MTCFVVEVKKMRAEISVPDQYCIAPETVWSLSYDLFFVLSSTALHARDLDPSRKTQRKISFKMSVLRRSETVRSTSYDDFSVHLMRHRPASQQQGQVICFVVAEGLPRNIKREAREEREAVLGSLLG